MNTLADPKVLLVDCRIGSLEMTALFSDRRVIVDCRIGSLEMRRSGQNP